MKLPEKKYEPKHNDKLITYVRGWNSTIDNIECLCKAFSDNCVKAQILRSKYFALTKLKSKTPLSFFKGRYDCIIEIERLNKKG